MGQSGAKWGKVEIKPNDEAEFLTKDMTNMQSLVKNSGNVMGNGRPYDYPDTPSP